MFDRFFTKSWATYEKHYKDVPTTNMIYRGLLKKYITPQAVVFDAGCGRNLEFVKFLAPLAKFTIGGDMVEHHCGWQDISSCAVLQMDLGHISLEDGCIHTIICHSVFEHLEDPLPALKEFNRILKTNGHLLFRTPNLFDFVSIAAKSLSQYLFSRHQNGGQKITRF